MYTGDLEGTVDCCNPNGWFIGATANTLVVRKAPGVTFDRYIADSKAKIEAILRMMKKTRNEDGSVTYLSGDMSKIATTRAALISTYNDILTRQKHLTNFIEKWTFEAIFDGGFFHGDVHAGNLIMAAAFQLIQEQSVELPGPIFGLLQSMQRLDETARLMNEQLSGIKTALNSMRLTDTLQEGERVPDFLAPLLEMMNPVTGAKVVEGVFSGLENTFAGEDFDGDMVPVVKPYEDASAGFGKAINRGSEKFAASYSAASAASSMNCTTRTR